MYDMKKEAAYRFIKQHIMNGTWSTGSAININKVMKELDISRTPVNKALRQLESEGFLTIIPQVGVFIKRPDEQEVYERLLICVQLDAFMTGHAALTITEEKLNELEKTLEKMENPVLTNEEYGELNTSFHSTIIYASGLDYMINLTKQFWDYLNYVSNPSDFFFDEVRNRSQIEHWMIYQSLKDKDGEMAKKVMERHMSRVAETVKHNLALR